MKKLLLLLLAATLTFSMMACSETSVEGDTSPSTEGTLPQEATGTQQESTTEPTQEVLPGKVWKIPTHEIYVTFPEGWIAVENNGVQAIMQDKNAMVAVTYYEDDALTPDLESVIAPASKRVVRNVYQYCAGNISNSQLEVKTTSACKMGGFDSLLYTGAITASGGYDCHVYGYSFVINGVGVVVCGMVTAESQDADMIAQIDALTDQIAASVRTEK